MIDHGDIFDATGTERRRATRFPRLRHPLGRRVLGLSLHGTITLRDRVPAHELVIATAYLVLIAVVEVAIVLQFPVLGIVAHAIILVSLLVRAAMVDAVEVRAFALSLTVAPTIRIVSLGMPLSEFHQHLWFMITSVPLFAASYALAKAIPLTRAEMRLQLPSPRYWLPTLAVALSGITLGTVEYWILRPQGMVEELTPGAILLPAISITIGTGLVEEIMFRGILQTTAIRLFGMRAGIVYVSLLFGLLHVGHGSALDVLFVIGVGLYFAAIAQVTRSLLGVTLAHSLANITLFIVLPILWQ